MKNGKKGVVSDEQEIWMSDLTKQGNKCYVCRTEDEFMSACKEYFGEEDWTARVEANENKYTDVQLAAFIERLHEREPKTLPIAKDMRRFAKGRKKQVPIKKDIRDEEIDRVHPMDKGCGC